MKALSTPVLLLFLILASCKTDKKAEVQEAAEEPGILDKVAQAHGYGHWDSVKEIRFTFNVDRDTTHFERSWIWKPGSSEVTGISAGDTVTYKRNAVDSTLSKLDGAFINDKYWFLAPFQLVWDRKNFSYEHTDSVSSPLAGKKMQKLTIVYGNCLLYTSDAADE